MTLSGEYIQKHSGVFVPVVCPGTKSGKCATAGETIAVDPTVIPLDLSQGICSHVEISGTGDRTAEDTGPGSTGTIRRVLRTDSG